MESSVRNIPFGKPMIGDEEKNAVMEILSGNVLVHGPMTKAFEAAFAAFTDAPRAVSVSSCTAGMHLVYFDLGIGPGDEVIVPAMTHVATAHAVEYTGAKPVFVDADPRSGNIDVDGVAAAVTPSTRAIAVVHYLGVPVDMKAIMAIAHRHGLFVLEDCALALGTRLDGVHAGLLGDAGSFSFYPVKHITTAEGGMVVTRHDALADRLERKRAFGVDRVVGERVMPGEYDVPILGFNYRMNEIEAALGVAQMQRVPEFLRKREENYQALRAALAGIEEIALFDEPAPGAESSRYCLSVVLREDAGVVRADVVGQLRANGVGTSVYYPKAVPQMRYYQEKYGIEANAFPVASGIAGRSIALPVGPHLTVEDMGHIAANLQQAIKEHKR